MTTTTPVLLGKGLVNMRAGRIVKFEVLRLHRPRCHQKISVRYSEVGPRSKGYRTLPRYFKTEDEAVAHVRRHWRPLRKGFIYASAS